MRLHRSVSRAVLGTVLATVVAGTAGPLAGPAQAVDDAGPPAVAKGAGVESGQDAGEQPGQADVADALWRRTAPSDADPDPTARVIVTLDVPGEVPARSKVAEVRSEVLDALPASGFDVVSRFSRLPMVSLEVDADGLAALAADPLVEAVQADQTMHLTMTEANRVTRADQAHARGYTGEGTTVAVIDTGVDVQDGVVHPGLADDLVGQQCFRTENDCIGGPSSAKDQNSHGTHVAGIITGPQGVAPDARFYAFKVFTTGNTSTTNILNALNRVVEINAANPGEIDEVNMSLGGGLYGTQAACDAAQPGYLQALSALNSQDVAVFVSTGNDARTNVVSSPGCVSGAIGVGSSGDATFDVSFAVCRNYGAVDKVDCYSNATPVQGDGELVDLMAPGCYITSLGLNGSTNANKCGTSMASPYAAGVGALARQAAAERNASFTPAELESWLEYTGVGITDYRIANSPTYPRVDALAAVTSDGGLPTSPTSMTATREGSGVRLDWGFSREPGATYAVERVQRGVVTQVGTTTDNTLLDADAACGPLTYRVRTLVGERRSLPVSASIQVRECLLAPSRPVLRAASDDSIRVLWTDQNSDEDELLLERRLEGESSFTAVAGYDPGTDFVAVDTPGSCGLATYRVVVRRTVDSTTSPTATRSACAPTGDDWDRSPTLPLDTTTTLPTARYASVDPTDPLHTCFGGGAATGGNTVWWQFTPRTNGTLSLSTAGSSGSDSDTVLSVYTGAPGSFASVACSEDASTVDLTSRLTNLALTRGTTYSVLVSRWDPRLGSADGTLRLASTWVPRAGTSTSPTSIVLEEGLGPVTTDVALTVAPDAAVTMTPTGDADCTVSPASLTFTPENYATPQQLAITAPDDGLDEGEHTCTVTAVATSTDGDYEGLELEPVTGTVTDALHTAIDLAAPLDGATFARGREVLADYGCSDNRDGAGIASCVGTVADGERVDTSSFGSHTFTVTLTDVHGRVSTETASYTVQPTPVRPRPDARIRLDDADPYTGNGLYGSRQGQVVEATLAPGESRTLTVSAQNDSRLTEALLVRAGASNPSLTVTYRTADGTDVTDQVTSGGWRTGTLAPGEQAELTVEVRLSRRASSRATVLRTFQVRSTLDDARRDRVHLRLNRGQ